MPKDFSLPEARRLTNEHRNISRKLLNAQNLPREFKEKIQNAAYKITLNEMYKELDSIPIEEINRDKRGYRLKALKDAGFNSICDVVKASERALDAVSGISEGAANEIKNLARDMEEEVKRGIRVKITVDNKRADISSLIKSIAQYRRSLEYAEKCKDIFSIGENVIPYAVNVLSEATNVLKWLFLPYEKKQSAKGAYNLLREYLVSDYGQRANRILAEVPECERLTVDEAWEDFERNPIRYFNVIEEFVPDFLGSSDINSYGLSEEQVQELANQNVALDGLLCELRSYQLMGVKYILHYGNVLLGDEMGLGKTVQAIAAMVSLKNAGETHFMVICPASVLTNWCREIRKHSLLDVVKIHGNDKVSAFSEWEEKGGVGITTYETAEYILPKEGFKISLLVVDEAHYIKNPNAKRSMNTKRISTFADRLLFMTGTALENNVEEMVNLIEMLNPAVASEVYGIRSLARSTQFKNKVATVYYRRKREDVLTELPELIENEQWCELGYFENKLYEETVLSKHFQKARRVSWQVEDLNDSVKARRLAEIIEDAKDDGRKVIVFSFFLETIDKISKYLGECALEPITGKVEAKRRQAIIDEFDKAEAGSVLILQIQSGGTGLNIQSASVVVICEPQLKPSIENQAISRAYRMGQTRNVLVYRLLCEDSIDERITDILKEKQKIFDAFADESAAAEDSEGISEELMKDILNKEIERIVEMRKLMPPIENEAFDEEQNQ